MTHYTLYRQRERAALGRSGARFEGQACRGALLPIDYCQGLGARVHMQFAVNVAEMELDR